MNEFEQIMKGTEDLICDSEFIPLNLGLDNTQCDGGEAFVVDDPLRCPVDKLIDGVQLVGTHDGEVTDLSMCQWMTNRLVSASQDGTVCIFLL